MIKVMLIFEDLFCLITGGFIVHGIMTVCIVLVEDVLRIISMKLFGQKFREPF